MSPAVRRQLRLRPIACAIAGGGLIQVALTLWIGLPDFLYFVAMGVLLGLAAGCLHWYYTVKCVEDGTVKDAQSLFWLDAAIPVALALAYTLVVSILAVLGVVDREIFSLRTVPMLTALGLFLFLRGIGAFVSGGEKRARPHGMRRQARYGVSTTRLMPRTRTDLFGEAGGLRWFAVFLGLIFICFIEFSQVSLATSLVGLVAVGTWAVVYAGGLGLYDGARGPFCFSWWRQPDTTGWNFESRSPGMSIELHRLDTNVTSESEVT